MSNIKEVQGKLRLYVSFLEYGRHVGQLRRRRRRRRAYAPTSNTASQDKHEKINSWVSATFVTRFLLCFVLFCYSLMILYIL